MTGEDEDRAAGRDHLDGHPRHPAKSALLEIRLLGGLEVRRPDGTLVQRCDWRTGKVADLLRLLALSGADSVATHTLSAALWPGSDQRHAGASLRTAASHLRRVVGSDFVERTLTGFRLRDVWVDVREFRDIAAQAHQLTIAGQPAAVHAITGRGDRLYRGEFIAHDDGADWAQCERRTLASAYQVFLCDAAEAAASMGEYRDAVDLAGRAALADPFSERASRLLMRGHSDLGEVSQALREYERCRRLLADELGVDPSPQTRELHLALLRSERIAPPAGNGAVESTSPTCLPPVGADNAEDRARTLLLLATTVLVPQRRFAQALRCADEAVGTSDVPGVRARALTISCLPQVLFGGAIRATEPLAEAIALAARCNDRLLSRRLSVLACLVAHDTGSPDFVPLWTHAAQHCEFDHEVNWGWLMIRIAVEHGDTATARYAARLPVAKRSGPLARQLHRLASATLLAELGDVEQAITTLSAMAEEFERQNCPLLLPETLGHLAVLQASITVCEAERTLVRLDSILCHQQGLPREHYLRLMAAASIHAARGRIAAAAAAAATAAEIAESHGLVHLTINAHDRCAEYTSMAQASAQGRSRRALMVGPASIAV